MEALHARYPFLDTAHESVEETGADLPALVASEAGPVVQRALERVQTAITEGRVGDPHRLSDVELLSYPVARVLVSLVDEPGLTRRYAQAEAQTAMDRFDSDLEVPDFQSVSAPRLTLTDLLAEFNLESAVEQTETGFCISVGAYLELIDELPGDGWRLVNRALANGLVPLSRKELDVLLTEAIRDRIEAGLPLSVPDEVADSLSESVADLRNRLADLDVDRDIDAVVPDLFPPCIKALLNRAVADPLEPHSRFALVAFLGAIGMDQESIADRLSEGTGDGAPPYGLDRLHDGEAGVYPPPSCATMVAYGDCVNKDELCDRIAHPLDYYERRLDRPEAEPAELADPYPRAESQ